MWTKAALGVPDRPALSPAAGISRSHSLEYDRMWSRDACAAQINVIVLAGVVQLHLILGGPRSGRPVGGRDDGVAARPPAVTWPRLGGATQRPSSVLDAAAAARKRPDIDQIYRPSCRLSGNRPTNSDIEDTCRKRFACLLAAQKLAPRAELWQTPTHWRIVAWF